MDSDQVSPRDLTSWKEIAAFLGVSERTAQNWETKHGLPVKRLPGARGRVLGITAELEQWKTKALVSRPGNRVPENISELADWGRKALASKQATKHSGWSSRFKTISSLSALVALAVIVGIVWIARNRPSEKKPGNADSFAIDGSIFIAKDKLGQELWRWSAPVPFLRSSYQNSNALDRSFVQFEDLERDSNNETIFAYDPVNRNEVGCRLYCLSDTGEVLWNFTPGRTVKTPGGTIEGPFIIANFLVADLDKGTALRKSS